VDDLNEIVSELKEKLEDLIIAVAAVAEDAKAKAQELDKAKDEASTAAKDSREREAQFQHNIDVFSGLVGEKDALKAELEAKVSRLEEEVLRLKEEVKTEMGRAEYVP
jgi:ABC-type transporter Mla subunit MlaD